MVLALVRVGQVRGDAGDLEQAAWHYGYIAGFLKTPAPGVWRVAKRPPAVIAPFEARLSDL
jgi:hypothetical protein